MLLTHDRYRHFTKRPIGDARRHSQALLALTVWMDAATPAGTP
jgi:predicted lactoylglutathione lyase